MTNLDVHALAQPSGWYPAAMIFPLMPEDELQGLAEHIAEKGLLRPIVLIGQQVLDGRNRLLACLKAQVEPHFMQWTPSDGLGPMTWVISCNGARI